MDSRILRHADLAVYIVLGAVVSTIVRMALANLLTHWDMPALTTPFVLTTWLLLFAVHQRRIRASRSTLAAVPILCGACSQAFTPDQ